MKNNLLYIGLNGYAGSGKDTVAKMIRTILTKDWNSLEECKTYYKSVYTDPTRSATFNDENNHNSRVLCIAYADQLKNICSAIFGVPIERFYMNKSTAWICINKKFEYTEIRPQDSQIVTADEYYYGISNYRNDNKKYWMSLREILVYVGTYVLQQDINKSIFVNVVRNLIKSEAQHNQDLKYVVITDNRFLHELDYIKENNGIMISIIRNGIEQLNNIAEHDLDEETSFDYVIDNSGTYDDLFEQVWNILHDNIEFHNIALTLSTRENNVHNYLRLVRKTDTKELYKLCAPLKIQKVYYSEGEIYSLDPVGGPTISVNKPLETEEYYEKIVSAIKYDEESETFFIIT